MVHMSYVPASASVPESTRTYRRDRTDKIIQILASSPEILRRGYALGPHWWKKPKELRQRHDERGAEMVEFAFVVVLLIALLYGIISYGLILAAQSTITQAAADGARAGIVASSTALSTSEAQAAQDVGWMGKGTCYQPDVPAGTSGAAISCTATKGTCLSNASNQCLTVTVSYNYAASPLFPLLPGMGVITPSKITSSNTLQISSPSS
jgi:Flp pilus assembly protein TadG